MRANFGVSATETSTILFSLLLVWLLLEVRIWRIFVWPRLNLPVPVFLKRLAAPEWVLSFGIWCVPTEENCDWTTRNSIPVLRRRRNEPHHGREEPQSEKEAPS